MLKLDAPTRRIYVGFDPLYSPIRPFAEYEFSYLVVPASLPAIRCQASAPEFGDRMRGADRQSTG